MNLDLQPVARRAAELIEPGSVVGLGTGRAATAFLEALAERHRAGLDVRGIATSKVTAERAAALGLPLTSLDEVESIDIAIDGADEVDPHLDLIKGMGGALVREKIVASAARKFVILVDSSKCVSKLGEHGTLPIEVVNFGLRFCQRKLAEMGLPSEPRKQGAALFQTDNGNAVLDCQIRELAGDVADELWQLDYQISEIPGVVETGLFLGMADIVLIQEGSSVRTARRDGTAHW